MEKKEIKVDISQLKVKACHGCKGEFFDRVVRLRKLPALLSPTGKDDVVALESYICCGCGEVVPNAAFGEVYPEGTSDEPEAAK